MDYTTRIIGTNYAVRPTASVAKVGTVPEDADNPLANALLPDRYTVWSMPASSGSNVVVILDLGGAFSINVVGLHGFNRSGSFPLTVKVDADTVTPPGLANSVNLNAAVDAFAQFATPITVRYLRFTFTACYNPFTLGKFLVGKTRDVSGTANIGMGLGLAHSSGTTRGYIMPRVRNRTVTGVPFVTSVGSLRKTMGLRLSSVPGEVRDIVSGAAVAPPFAMIDGWNQLSEFDVPGDAYEETHVWGSPDLFDISLDLEALP